MLSHLEIIDKLLDSKPDEDNSPTEWQFDQLQILVDEIPITEICSAIYERYNPAAHDRNILAMIFSMLIWHSSEHDLAVSDFMHGWLDSNDSAKIGISVSRFLEWYPFGTPEKTLEDIDCIAQKYPEFKNDCEFWKEMASKELIHQKV